MYLKIDLFPFVNNKGVTNKEELKEGDLAFGGFSFPYDEFNRLQGLNKDIPFTFFIDNPVDNIELEGQIIDIPLKKYCYLYLVGTSNNGDFMDTIELLRGVEVISKEDIYFPDMNAEVSRNQENIYHEFSCIHSKYGSVKHLKPKLWINSIVLNNKSYINKIKFPDNPSIHIFSITLKERGGDS